MKVGRIAKWGAIAIVVIIAAAYMALASDYQNEYEVDVSFSVSSSGYVDADVTDLVVTSQAMEPMSFFDTLKASAEVRGTYTVYVELNQSGVLDTQTLGVLLIPDEPMIPVSFQFFEKAPGEANVRIYIMHVAASTIVYDRTTAVVIG
jgi:hypothetical protein